ncbi:hypothetical protein ACQ4N7_20245 [Nodosilinea sp. AN01ver1]|uniref:hypothetical protein n=1 Tax=Nodosilinea sp. AN01ver1 TaxID=3423362 RepID=UPI003D323D79
MPRISKVELKVLSMSSSNATLEVEVTTSFYSREIASNAVFDCEVILENEDGLGDLDIRCKTIGRTWMVASSEPVTKSVKATVDRNFLNEDFTLFPGGPGDTTDEWRAKVKLTPFSPPAETVAISNTIRREFQP